MVKRSEIAQRKEMEVKARGQLSALLWLLAASLCLEVAKAAVVEYDFHVEHAFRHVACVRKAIYVVNGIYPGPVINVTEGDTVVVNVHNMLYTESTSIHFHGIHQRGTPFYDGAAGSTQCPIHPGETFTYNFTVRGQVGTFWWHSHYGLQRVNGLYGLMIVNPRPSAPQEADLFGYDEELEPMLLNDWWHLDPLILEAHFKQPVEDPFLWDDVPEEPSVLLINGKGVSNCRNTEILHGLHCNNTSPDCGYQVYEVELGKRYRIRLVAVTADTMVAFSIQGHNLTVVAADTSYTDPVEFPALDIHTGQTYSVVFTADQVPGDYWITSHIRDAEDGPVAAVLLRYKGYLVPYAALQLPAIPPNPTDHTSLYPSLRQQRRIVTRAEFVTPVPDYDREIILMQNLGMAKGYAAFAVNNHSYVYPSTPTLLQEYYGMGHFNDTGKRDSPALTWNYMESQVDQGIPIEVMKKSLKYSIDFNQTIQIIFQNSITFQGDSDLHPWHLHGHDFWVLGWGSGIYNSTTSQASFNLENPAKRNTVVLYPDSWLAIRFKADNPGYWSLHCHLALHMLGGMEVGFYEAIESLPPLPKNFPVCGFLTPSVIKNNSPRF